MEYSPQGVSFVLPTYNRVALLKCALQSLIVQTNENWDAQVVIDGLDYEEPITQMIEELNDPRIIIRTLSKRYNDWGHTGRELGKTMARYRWVVMTGDDNYYVPTTVKEILEKAEQFAHYEAGMIYWDMVHSHYDYSYFVCSAGFNQIDIGAFATRNDLAKQIKLTSDYAADGLFVEEYKKKFPTQTIVKIKKVLYVHN